MDDAIVNRIVGEGDALLKKMIDERAADTTKLDHKEFKALAEVIGLRGKLAIAAARAASEADVNDAIAVAGRAMVQLLSPANMQAVIERHVTGQGLGEVTAIPARRLEMPEDLPDVEVLPGELDAVVLRTPESFD